MVRELEVLAAAVLAAVLAVVPASAQSSQKATVADDYEVTVDPTVTGRYVFAHGFGLIYAPMPITRELRALETKFPNAKIEWQNIFTTAQQRDAMLAGQLDFGSCTPGPYLQSWDKGVDWKWLQVTSGFDAYLMVQPDGPDSLPDFIGTTKKISPGPNTAQYFAAQELLRQLNRDPKSLDRNWVNLPHPDAIQAMIAKQLDGHWATADFALELLSHGFKRIASFRQIYGGLNAVGACALTKTLQASPALAQGYAEVLRQTATWMKRHPDKAAEAMSKSVGGKVSPADFTRYMSSDLYATYTQDADLKGQAESMRALGVISRKFDSAADFYAYPDQAGTKW
jgi:ABC-type nitrate/sulfonate/bicarbonate transport system substrate-binding protein